MIGKTLYYIRKLKNINQRQLAQSIGIARNTISQYENGKIQPTFETIEKIANICDFSIIFRNDKTNDEVTTSSIQRKDIKKN